VVVPREGDFPGHVRVSVLHHGVVPGAAAAAAASATGAGDGGGGGADDVVVAGERGVGRDDDGAASVSHDALQLQPLVAAAGGGGRSCHGPGLVRRRRRAVAVHEPGGAFGQVVVPGRAAEQRRPAARRGVRTGGRPWPDRGAEAVRLRPRRVRRLPGHGALPRRVVEAAAATTQYPARRGGGGGEGGGGVVRGGGERTVRACCCCCCCWLPLPARRRLQVRAGAGEGEVIHACGVCFADQRARQAVALGLMKKGRAGLAASGAAPDDDAKWVGVLDGDGDMIPAACWLAGRQA